jgi:hypothetical protein
MAGDELEKLILTFCINLKNVFRKNGQLQAELDEWKQKCQALNEELRLIREMSTKQDYMGNKVIANTFKRLGNNEINRSL